MEFREKLLRTLRAVSPLFEEEGVVVIGSEVPNLLEPNAASSLVVSQDVDLGIDVRHHASVRARLAELQGLTRSKDEPSVWLPTSPDLIEVNFVGFDPRLVDPTEAYALEDDELPLLVFGGLSFVLPPKWCVVEELRIPLANPAGLLLEKLLTDRTGEKGDRDLLVVIGLLRTISPTDIDAFVVSFASLPPVLRASIRSNLSILSLMDALPQMPDPVPMREQVARLLLRLGEH